jgi:hypothetical protein
MPSERKGILPSLAPGLPCGCSPVVPDVNAI